MPRAGETRRAARGWDHGKEALRDALGASFRVPRRVSPFFTSFSTLPFPTCICSKLMDRPSSARGRRPGPTLRHHTTMNRPKVIFIAVLAATSTSSRFGAEAAKQCYYPNGQIATGDSPCNPDDEASSCCGGTEGAQCLSNNVCSNPGGNPVRGTCTDQNWNSVECPRFCVRKYLSPICVSTRLDDEVDRSH